jgi:hypothetical protein
MKNRVFAAFALVALLGTAACGDDAEEAEVVEESQPVVIPDSVYVDPAVTEGAIIMDTTEAAISGSNPAADTSR